MKNLTVLFLLVMLLIFMTGCSAETERDDDNPDSSNDVDFSENDDKEIIPSNNELGFKLLPEVEVENNENTFISPTSLFTALSMIYNGADGVTKEEIAKTLNAKGIDVKALNKPNASLMSMINKDSDHVQFDIANAIWLNEDFQFQDEFAQQNKDYFNAATNEININDDKSAKKINDWVNKQTNGKIEKMVDDPLNPDFVAILINAIYFKGDWTNEFDKNETEDYPFHLADGTTKDVALMKLTEDLAYLENEDFQAVSLPYAEEEMSMKIFLPKEKSSLKKFKQMVTSQNWEVWNSEFQTEKGAILFPKFEIEYETSLNETLQQLGLKSAFDESADFSKMIQEDDRVWISQVKQKTFIEVNEEGTESSAATSAEMETVSAPIGEKEPFHMKVNRPFFFTITDDETGAILFMGSVNEP